MLYGQQSCNLTPSLGQRELWFSARWLAPAILVSGACMLLSVLEIDPGARCGAGRAFHTVFLDLCLRRLHELL
jgi:hypothetical protein